MHETPKGDQNVRTSRNWFQARAGGGVLVSLRWRVLFRLEASNMVLYTEDAYQNCRLTSLGSGPISEDMSTMKHLEWSVARKAVGLALGALLLAASAGCATVRPEQRAILADPTMQFDAKSAIRQRSSTRSTTARARPAGAPCAEAAAAAIEGARVDTSPRRVSRSTFADHAARGRSAGRAALAGRALWPVRRAQRGVRAGTGCVGPI